MLDGSRMDIHQRRDEGGQNSPGAESLRGAPSDCRVRESPNNFTSRPTSFNKVYFRTWGPNLLLAPGAN